MIVTNVIVLFSIDFLEIKQLTLELVAPRTNVDTIIMKWRWNIHKIVGQIPARIDWHDASTNRPADRPVQYDMWADTWAYRYRPIQYFELCLSLGVFTWAGPELG